MGFSLKDLGEPFKLTTNTAWIQFSDKLILHQHKETIVNAAKKVIKSGTIKKILLKYYPKEILAP